MRSFTSDLYHLRAPIVHDMSSWTANHQSIDTKGLQVVSNVRALEHLRNRNLNASIIELQHASVRSWSILNSTVAANNGFDTHYTGLSSIGESADEKSDDSLEDQQTIIGTFRINAQDGTLILAYNGWNARSLGASDDVGIGNYLSPSPSLHVSSGNNGSDSETIDDHQASKTLQNWLFAGNAQNFYNKVLSVFVRRAHDGMQETTSEPLVSTSRGDLSTFLNATEDTKVNFASFSPSLTHHA